MFDPQLFDDLRREDSGGEGTAEDVNELLIETTDAHLLEVPVGREEACVCRPCLGVSQRY